MSFTYAKTKKAEDTAPKKAASPAQPSLDALRSGVSVPTREQMGRRVDLPDAMREKMESAFGADLSAVRLYESETVADAGANAVTRGADIAFAPGILDFSSFGGQALLGHELSHVVSQARGEVTGSGFLNDHALEARADREGAMAAAGQKIAMPTAAMSGVTAAAAAGPMQADKFQFPWNKKKPDEEEPEPVDEEEPESVAEEEVKEGQAETFTPLIHDEDDTTEEPEAGSTTGPTVETSDDKPKLLITDDDDDEKSSLADTAPKASVSRKSSFEFASETQQRRGQFQLAPNGISFVLGNENLRDKKHGEQFGKLRGALNRLAYIRANPKHYSGMAHEAMLGNAFSRAVQEMQSYRDVLSGEKKGNEADRARQIKFLDTVLAQAAADQASIAEGQSTTLSTEEQTGSVSGGVNKVGRFSRGGKGAFFKPQKSYPEEKESGVMAQVGIRYQLDKRGDYATDPHLSAREIAYSRLGSLLGSSVTMEAKRAIDKNEKAGVLTEEAPGTDWRKYNWEYQGIAPDQNTVDSEEAFRSIMLGDDRSPGSETIGSRIKKWFTRSGSQQQKFSFKKKSTKDAGNKAMSTALLGVTPATETIDADDADFQREMNEMFILDTLSSHRDRHSGNYHVGRGADGKVSVRAIDNDLTFGAMDSADQDRAMFGKRDKAENYGGLPAQMQIDANMAEKILAMDEETLKDTFSDLLDEKEIAALWTRFEMMQKYIEAMKQANLIVKKWDSGTAKRELELAGGVGSYAREQAGKAEGYSGNSYYQRHLLMLNAAERAKDRDDPLLRGARGQ